MPLEQINLGSTANDGTGDSLRAAGAKINAAIAAADSALQPGDVSGVSTTVYIDSENGNDANSGASQAAPVESLGAAKALLSAGMTLSIARGSRFFDLLQAATWPANIHIRTHGTGAKPIFDGSRVATGSVTKEGTATNVYKFTQTHEFQTVGSESASGATKTHYQVWSEPDVGAAKMLLRHDDGASITDAIAYVDANPGTFFCHRVGSTDPDPRNDTGGTEYTYYIHLHDSSDASAFVGVFYYNEETKVFRPGAGWTVRGIRVQRGAYSAASGSDDRYVGLIEHCEFESASTHAWVGPTNFRDCIAIGGQGSEATGGGGFHFYFSDSGGPSDEISAINCHAKGFQSGYYSHGNGGQYTHQKMTLRDCIAEDCKFGFNLPTCANGAFLERVQAVGVDVGAVVAKSFASVVNGHFEFRAIGGSRIIDHYSNEAVVENVVGWNPGEAYAEIFDGHNDTNKLTLRGCTFVGRFTGLSLDKCRLHLENTIFGEIPRTNSGSLTLTARNSYLWSEQRTLGEIQAEWPGVESDCVTPWVENTLSFTAAADDIAEILWRSDAAGTSGSAAVTVGSASGNGVAVGMVVRVADYDGAGGDWIAPVTEITSNTLTLASAPDATFSGKDIYIQHYKHKQFPVDAGTMICTHNVNETLVTFSNPEYFGVGTMFRVDGLRSLWNPGGIHIVTAIDRATGQAVIDPPSVMDPHNNPALNWGTVPRAEYPVRFGWVSRAPNGAIGTPGAQVSITHPGMPAITATEASTADFNLCDKLGHDGQARAWAIDHFSGENHHGLPAMVGTIITLTQVVHVSEYSDEAMGVPTPRGGTPLPAEHYLMRNGIGARAW